MRHFTTAVSLCLLIMSGLQAQPFTPDSRTLLLDHFDEAFTPDGKLMTRPAVGKPQGPLTGGQPMAGLSFVAGKFGQALQFHGLTKMDVPAGSNLDLSAGTLEFWTALNFDAAKQMKDPGVLSNQLFCAIGGPRGSEVSVYSCLNRLCVGVWDTNRQLIAYTAVPGTWKQDEWHHVRLAWGRQLVLSVDDVQSEPVAWFGLFGPVDVRPDDLRLYFGSHIGMSAVESEFRLDELRVLGPGGEQVPDHPMMAIPRLKAPQLDGNLEDSEWADAAQTTGFVGLNDDALVEDQTTLYCGWDDTALYVAADCRDPKERPIVAQLKDRDAAVFMEDALDIILQPGPEPYPYFQLVTNAAGTRYDSAIDQRQVTKVDQTFDPDWTVATTRAAGRWTMEARIPFAALKRPTPKDGERWRANFCRDADAAARLSSWAYTAGNFHRIESYGEIVFNHNDRAVRLGPLGDWATGKVNARFALAGPTVTPVVTFTATLIGGDAKPLLDTHERFADYRALDLKPATLVTGLYHLTIRAETDGRELYYHRLPFRVMKPFDIRVENYPYEGKLWVIASVAGVQDTQGAVARARLMQGDRVIDTCQTDQFSRGIGQAAIASEAIPPGKYVVRGELVGADGKALGSAEADWEQFAKPAWWRSPAGADHRVPVPWKPVRVDGAGIQVLGRTYRVGAGSLPTQIVNQGQEMLAGPMTLVATADGKTLDLGRLRALDATNPDDASVRRASGALGALQARLTTTTEFDGLQRYDLTLTPQQATSLQSLVLTIPVKRSCATFMLSSNGRSGTPLAVGDQPWKSGFLPQVWLGNDDMGLAWFAESDQWWRPHDDQMLQVVPERDRVTLRCAIVRQPLKLDGPVTITFGLMATPTKDGHAGDPFYYRIGGVYGNQPLMEFCRYPAAGNVDPQQGTLECWMAPAPGGTSGWREIVCLQGKEGSVALAYDGAQAKALLTRTEGKEKQSATADNLRLQPGQFAHVALTWGDQVSLYVDGKRVATLAGGLGAEPQGLRLGCASEWVGYTGVIVDELRSSRGLRYTGDSFAPPTTPFAADAQTLLLDHFDTPFRPDGEDAETRPAVISGQSGELGGIPSIGCSFAAGKFGPGLQLAIAPSLEPQAFVDKWKFNASLFWFWFEDDALTAGWPPPLLIEPLMKNLRGDVKLHRDLKLRPFPYMGYMGIGAPNAVSEQFGDEWRRMPLSTQPAEPPRGHYYLDVCGQARGFGDYMAAGTQWLLDDVGFQGCYTDGNGHVYPCQNTHHGCGYVDESGVLHATWPIFASRDYLKRMYRLIHAKNADGILVNHVSYDTFIPTQSFTDIYYTGEHEQYEDLLKHRVRWQGKQWGFWVTPLGPDSHSYEALHMTYALLHGVSIWPQGWQGRNDMLRKTANIWLAYDRFGYRAAQWLPYYRATKLVKPDRETVKASLYLRRGQRALIVIGNLEPKVVEAKLALDLKAMGLRGKVARNALSDQPLTLQGGQLTARLRPHSMVLAWVE